MRSFDLVDFKVAEADFFFRKLRSEAVDPLTVSFYFSAYSAAARSITFCLQAVLKDLPGFESWYLKKQDELKRNPLARFFVDARNISQKVGVVPIERGVVEQVKDDHIHMKFYFAREHPDFKSLPNIEVDQACKENLRSLIKVVYDCYVDFGTEIDPHQHYTKTNFERLERTIDDADEELMGIRGWTHVEGWPEEYRWQSLREQLPGCRIDHLFEEYLKLVKPSPPRMPDNPDEYKFLEWIPPCLQRKRT